MGRIRAGKVAAENTVMEFWVLEACAYCHDSLWANAEKGDIRSLDKPVAVKLMEKNPGKFRHVDTLMYRNGDWSDMRGKNALETW
jgi:hypothetical protein